MFPKNGKLNLYKKKNVFLKSKGKIDLRQSHLLAKSWCRCFRLLFLSARADPGLPARTLIKILLRGPTWPMSKVNHLPLPQSHLTPQCSHYNPPSFNY